MVKNNFFAILKMALILTVFSNAAFSQQVVNHDVDFNTSGQNMWGPSFSPFTIDQEITLFEVGWNESFSTGNSMIFSVAGQSFGAALAGSFSGLIGSKVSLNGFTTGTIDADYPIDIVLDMPTDLTYDQGDVVTILTDYAVDPAAELTTYYPSVGEAKWDLYFQLAASASATLCAFGCTTFPIIPAFNTGLVNLNLVTANASGLWFLGPADMLSPDLPGIGGFPFSKSPETSGSCSAPSCLPWQCHVPGFPFDLPDAGVGITGSITIPYVETTSYINGNDLSACGDSTYFNLNLEIFQLIGALNIPYVSAVLGNLSGSQSFGPAEVNWNFFSASFDANITNKQCFDFTPKIYGEFVFPVAVIYSIIEPSNGSVISSGTSSIINLQIGKSLQYKFPCYFETVNITPTYSIIGTIRNHTYDSISFDFLMSAFEFGFEIPAITVIPSFTFPEICIPYGYPCGSVFWPSWCTGESCTPAYTTPAIGFPGLSYSIGPLWSTSIPLGSIEYDWFDQTWDLEGFTPITLTAFAMNARRLLASATSTNVSCYGGNNGAIDVTLTNAEFPVAYTWTNGATTQDLSSITEGPYEVSAIDANGCQLFTGATILQPQQPLSLSAVVTDKSCNGGVNNGVVDVTVIGGTAPYTYLWNTGATSEDINSLNVGTYSLTVTDARSCTAVVSGTVQQPNILGQVAAINDVKCFGEATGNISIDVFGGVLPYNFSWNSGQITEDIASLSSGSYTLTITDGKNCVNAQTYLIAQPAAPLSLTSSVVNVNCHNAWTGSINVTTSGGTGGYSYEWSNSSGVILPYQTEDLSSIPASSYTVLSTDSKGCQFTLAQTVSQPAAPLSSSPILTNINCFGAATGSINPVIAGGTAPYSYSWSNASTSSTLTGIMAGTYSLTVTDLNACSATYTYTLSQPSNPLSIVLSGTDILCFGNSTGSVSSVTSGGTAPYSYLWSNGSTNSSISNLIAGSYTITSTDNLGCTATNSIVLTEPAAPLAASSAVTNVSCFGGNDGAIDLTVTGGTIPYSYAWSNGQSIVLASISQDLNSRPANTYTVLITDNNGCQETLVSTITQPSAPLFFTGVIDDVNCFGLNDGGINTTISGGTLPYSFAWSNGANTEDILGLIAGNYTLTVTDALACVTTNTYSVVEPNAALTATTFTNSALCNGGTTGAVESEVTGGTTPYTYAWSHGATTIDIDQVPAGPYSLTVTDFQGCTAFTGAVVNQPAVALLVVPTITQPSCYGYSDGQIELTISGGTQPYYFNWGNQNEIMLNNSSEILTGLSATNYFIRIRDKNGCTVEQTITVNQPTALNSSFVVTDVLCYGDNTGSVNLTITGATPVYTVLWSNGQTTEDVTNLLAGEYQYTITDNMGCVYRTEVMVTQPQELKITYNLIPVTCIDQTDAELYVNPYGGTMPYSYSWSNAQITQNASDLAPGDYVLTITDDNSCISTFNFVIEMTNEACLDIPNTITPNGDNYNDTWILENLDLYPEAQVKIFNKWGNLLYASSGAYTPWDGTINDEPLPSEVYYYIIELKNQLDNKYTGTITIIR